MRGTARRPTISAGLILAAALGLAAGSGCGEDCCTFESRPVPLVRGSGGELLAHLSTTGSAPAGGEPGAPFPALIDTATPVSLWNVEPLGAGAAERSFRLLGTSSTGSAGPVRGLFNNVVAVGSLLGPVGSADSPSRPLALLGGDFLSAFSVEIGFATPEVTLWERQPANDGFLSAVGHAVLHVGRYGAGELETRGPENALGERGPYQYPASTLVLRTCAGPASFTREQELPTACCRGEERQNATGTDLALALGTGVGPVMLSRSAWNRVVSRLPAPPPAPVERPLLVATVEGPIPAMWSTLPRLALVDREASTDDDPGPCAELGRARRLEQVAFRQVMNAEAAACALPCDRDRRNDGIAQSSAGYIELSGDIEVAIVADELPLLQSLRARVRPNGPEVDGILGAAALRNSRVELNYGAQPSRAIFSCERGVPLDRCRAVSRCPRLPGRGPVRACFGLPAHGLPRVCDNQVSTCG